MVYRLFPLCPLPAISDSPTVLISTIILIFTCFQTLYKWNHTVWTLLYSASFTQHYVCMISPLCSLYDVFHFLCCIPLCDYRAYIYSMVGEYCGCFQFLAFTNNTVMDILYVSWWTSVHISVEYAGMCRVAESVSIWSAVVDTDSWPQWLYPFTFPHAVDDCFSCFIFLTVLGIVSHYFI